MILLDWAEFQSDTLFSSVMPFQTESVLNEWSSLISMLTLNGTDLGKTYYARDVDNFDTFAASINKPLYDKRFRSNDFWKWVMISESQVVVLEISVWMEESDLST
jgi:hypothetical protein